MAPALGTFRATLTLGKRSYSAAIQVHDDIHMPLLSYDHCQELGFIFSDFPKQILEVNMSTCVRSCLFLPSRLPQKPGSTFARIQGRTGLQGGPLGSPIKLTAGPPMRIHLKDDVVPFTINASRQILFGYRNQVKDELNSMVAQRLIKPACNEPWEWCHPLVVISRALKFGSQSPSPSSTSKFPNPPTLHQLHSLLYVVWTRKQRISLQKMPCVVTNS